MVKTLRKYLNERDYNCTFVVSKRMISVLKLYKAAISVRHIMNCRIIMRSRQKANWLQIEETKERTNKCSCKKKHKIFPNKNGVNGAYLCGTNFNLSQVKYKHKFFFNGEVLFVTHTMSTIRNGFVHLVCIGGDIKWWKDSFILYLTIFLHKICKISVFIFTAKQR